MSRNPIRFCGIDQEVSGVVRAELSRAHISQAEMARRLHMHPNVFGRKARGQVAFSAAELVDVAAELGTTAAALIDEADTRYRATHAAETEAA
ncbi:hypothetical protein CWT12_12445 [Actinomyces sp. 432]|uniref:helix-turn-helix domain-containing protein n=1 Tax=Actinomyces sp. 432 TaxID=2057798 RepID=UPI0013742A99|nr:helix-turn-helix transcriptional regulator [Actinomyces sp. 432]QHO91960.1 hypothetical protein CWT12_12445 [Actinomyces sp. 432]